MRLAAKMMLWSFCAAPAAAAMVLTGSGAANAAVAAPAAHSVATHNPWGPGPHCSWWDREQWNVNGHNMVKLVFNSTTYTYTVDFKQNGSCLGGTLIDTYLPGSPSLPLSGTIDDHGITFSVIYPPGVQGIRTFTGTITWHGDVYGHWSETGTEHGTGPWYLVHDADHACSHYYWWDPQRECHVYSH